MLLAVLKVERLAEEALDVCSYELWLLESKEVSTLGRFRPLANVVAKCGHTPWQLVEVIMCP